MDGHIQIIALTIHLAMSLPQEQLLQLQLQLLSLPMPPVLHIMELSYLVISQTLEAKMPILEGLNGE